MKYKLLTATTVEEFEKLVTDAMADGFVCCGGVVLTPPGGAWDSKPKFYQSMAKTQTNTAAPKAKA